MRCDRELGIANFAVRLLEVARVVVPCLIHQSHHAQFQRGIGNIHQTLNSPIMQSQGSPRGARVRVKLVRINTIELWPVVLHPGGQFAFASRSILNC